MRKVRPISLYGFLFFVGLLIVSVFIKPSRAADTVILRLEPQSQIVEAGSSFSLTVLVDADTLVINGVTAYLNFDPSFLEVTAIEASDSLDVSLDEDFDNALGQIDIARGTFMSDLTGTFEVATITFQAGMNNTTTTIDFNAASPRLSDISFADSAQEGSVLEETQAASIQIGSGGGETPTSTVTPTSTSTSTPSATPSATPSPTPEAGLVLSPIAPMLLGETTIFAAEYSSSFNRAVWDFGDGSPFVNTGQALQTTYTYSQTGTYEVVLTLFDTTDTPVVAATIMVEVLPMVLTTESVPLGDEIVVLAQVSPLLPYSFIAWDFGDSTAISPTTGAEARYLYLNAGEYTVQASLVPPGEPIYTDQDETAQVTVTVRNPGMDASYDGPVLLGQTATFTIVLSDFALERFGMVEADFGDTLLAAHPAQVGSDEIVTIEHLYTRPGNYVAAFRLVSDIYGSAIVSDTLEVTVAPPSLTLSGPDTALIGAPIDFNIVLSDMALADFAVLELNYGDGSPTTGESALTNGESSYTFTHTFNNTGSYQVSVRLLSPIYGEQIVTDTLSIDVRSGQIFLPRISQPVAFSR